MHLLRFAGGHGGGAVCLPVGAASGRCGLCAAGGGAGCRCRGVRAPAAPAAGGRGHTGGERPPCDGVAFGAAVRRTRPPYDDDRYHRHQGQDGHGTPCGGNADRCRAARGAAGYQRRVLVRTPPRSGAHHPRKLRPAAAFVPNGAGWLRHLRDGGFQPGVKNGTCHRHLF